MPPEQRARRDEYWMPAGPDDGLKLLHGFRPPSSDAHGTPEVRSSSFNCICQAHLEVIGARKHFKRLRRLQRRTAQNTSVSTAALGDRHKSDLHCAALRDAAAAAIERTT